jgi:lipoprotein-releasing system ATP-binding protein
MPALIAIRGLRKAYVMGDETVHALAGVDLDFQKGEFVAILGPSGSGKSTLLQAVGLLEGGFSGSIKLDGEEVSTAGVDRQTEIRRQKLGFVYQFHHLLPDFDALENVILPQLIADTMHDAALDRATYLLAQLGLSERLHHRPSKLSGGEQQRVAVARALANRPKLVLADEPTGNLDEHTADIVLSEFMALVRGVGSSAIVATHNERLAAKMDRIVRLHDGKLG